MDPQLIHALASVENLRLTAQVNQTLTGLTLSPAENYSADTSRTQQGEHSGA
jgi:hypothetical protein